MGETISIPDSARPYLAACAAAEAVSCRQMAVLAVIDANPGVSVGPVAKALGISKPAVTRAMDRLGNIEWATRAVDTADRRKVLLRATDAGRAALASAEVTP